MGADANWDWQVATASALDWWREAGVDVELSDTPRDWFAAPAAAPRLDPTAVPPPAAPVQLPATLEAFATWRTGADAPESSWGTPLLPPSGPVDASLMILVELPEREDAAEGRLLSGAAGRLFDRMLAAIGHSRDTVHVASIAAARPIAGRIPREAIEPLSRIAQHYVGLVAPQRLLLLGNASARVMLAMDCASARGNLRPLNHDGATITLASFHPAFLLERPQAKAEAWKDLQMLLEAVRA